MVPEGRGTGTRCLPKQPRGFLLCRARHPADCAEAVKWYERQETKEMLSPNTISEFPATWDRHTAGLRRSDEVVSMCRRAGHAPAQNNLESCTFLAITSTGLRSISDVVQEAAEQDTRWPNTTRCCSLLRQRRPRGLFTRILLDGIVCSGKQLGDCITIEESRMKS